MDHTIKTENLELDEFESKINLEHNEGANDESLINKADDMNLTEEKEIHIEKNKTDIHNNENDNIVKEGINHDQFSSNYQAEVSPKFYDDLRCVIKIQENILTSTTLAKEKIKYANEISIDQLKNFKDNSFKYGKYLKLVQEELSQINDLMKKIKKEIK